MLFHIYCIWGDLGYMGYIRIHTDVSHGYESAFFIHSSSGSMLYARFSSRFRNHSLVHTLPCLFCFLSEIITAEVATNMAQTETSSPLLSLMFNNQLNESFSKYIVHILTMLSKISRYLQRERKSSRFIIMLDDFPKIFFLNLKRISKISWHKLLL